MKRLSIILMFCVLTVGMAGCKKNTDITVSEVDTVNQNDIATSAPVDDGRVDINGKPKKVEDEDVVRDISDKPIGELETEEPEETPEATEPESSIGTVTGDSEDETPSEGESIGTVTRQADTAYLDLAVPFDGQSIDNIANSVRDGLITATELEAVREHCGVLSTNIGYFKGKGIDAFRGDTVRCSLSGRVSLPKTLDGSRDGEIKDYIASLFDAYVKCAYVGDLKDTNSMFVNSTARNYDLLLVSGCSDMLENLSVASTTTKFAEVVDSPNGLYEVVIKMRGDWSKYISSPEDIAYLSAPTETNTYDMHDILGEFYTRYKCIPSAMYVKDGYTMFCLTLDLSQYQK